MTDKKIESVQIIKIEEAEFVFDYDAVKKIIDDNPECADLPIGIVIINGALRTGKSFFNNFVIRHLMRLDDSSEYPEGMLVDYFRSRRGTDIQTLGIWALNKIFVHNGMGIVLMDTQGIFDRELNQAMTTALICLSTLMSSYQIYNLDKRIQEDHLNNMAYFSAYTDLMDSLHQSDSIDDSISNDWSDNDSSKIGQTLSLLVRDWQNFEDSLDLASCKLEVDEYQKKFLSDDVNVDAVKRSTRTKIMNTYDTVNVRLCPHPGLPVTEGVFSGNLSIVRPEFLLHMDYIIDDILDNIEPKRVSGNVELRCSDLADFMGRYVELYRNIKESLPKPQTILETTTKISQTSVKTNTVSKYKQLMMNKIKPSRENESWFVSGPDLSEIANYHSNAKMQAYKHFNSACVMGEERDIREIMNAIEADINDEYQAFKLMATEKNVMYRLNLMAAWVAHKARQIMQLDLQSIGLGAMMGLVMFLRILISFILPEPLYFMVDWIASNAVWIMLGMMLLRYSESGSTSEALAIGRSHPVETPSIKTRKQSKAGKQVKHNRADHRAKK